MSEVYLLMFGKVFAVLNAESEEFYDTIYGIPLAVFPSRDDALAFLDRLSQAMERIGAGEDYRAVAEEMGLSVSLVAVLLGMAASLGSTITNCRFSLLKYEDGKFSFEVLEPIEEQQDAMLA